MKKRLNILLILLVLFTGLILSPNFVHADSDWGTSYDSGSSSDWSSSDWSSSGGSYSSGDDIDPVTAIIILIIVLVFVFVYNKKVDKDNLNLMIKDMSQEEIDAIDPTLNKQEVIQKCFDIYKDIQDAWMNFDYDRLARLQTDEVYNNQKMKLETLKLKNQQNVMENITLLNGAVEHLEINNKIETITLGFEVLLKDYVIDTNTKKIVRGNKENLIITYRITYQRTLEHTSDICPNCGAKLDNNTSRFRCDYCNSVLVKSSEEFVLSKKTNISQRRS